MSKYVHYIYVCSIYFILNVYVYMISVYMSSISVSYAQRSSDERLRVGAEAVDGHHGLHAVLPHVLDVRHEVRAALLHQRQVLLRLRSKAYETYIEIISISICLYILCEWPEPVHTGARAPFARLSVESRLALVEPPGSRGPVPQSSGRLADVRSSSGHLKRPPSSLWLTGAPIASGEEHGWHTTAGITFPRNCLNLFVLSCSCLQRSHEAIAPDDDCLPVV